MDPVVILPATKLRVKTLGKTTSIPEYCRTMIVEKKLPLYTIFKALYQKDQLTVGTLVSNYTPSGIGSAALVQLFQFFEDNELLIIHKNGKAHSQYCFQLLPKWAEFALYMQGMSSEKAKRKGKVRESPKSRCEQELTSFLQLHEGDWKKRLRALGLEPPPYACVRSMMIVARLSPTYLQKLYPEEFQNDPTVLSDFLPKKRGRVPRDRDNELL